MSGNTYYLSTNNANSFSNNNSNGNSNNNGPSSRRSLNNFNDYPSVNGRNIRTNKTKAKNAASRGIFSAKNRVNKAKLANAYKKYENFLNKQGSYGMPGQKQGYLNNMKKIKNSNNSTLKNKMNQKVMNFVANHPNSYIKQFASIFNGPPTMGPSSRKTRRNRKTRKTRRNRK
jgi:hypothetical protein